MSPSKHPILLSIRFRAPWVSGVLLGLLAAWPLALSASWYSECPNCEKYIGGNSSIGPFATKPACQEYVDLNIRNNYPYNPCHGSDDSSASADASSSSSLQDSTTQALSYGIANGNSEALGLGMMGLGVMALTSAPSGPSPAEQAAQQRAAQEQAERYQAAQAAKKRKFEAEKRETLQDLKGNEATSSPEDFGLKGDDSDGLKDVPRSRPKKKFKPPHLKPMADPLHKELLPGDVTGATLFDDWDTAKIFANGNGGTIARESSGKIVWCAKGFPYACGGHCYTEAAFNDFRIPCDSKLKTTQP